MLLELFGVSPIQDAIPAHQNAVYCSVTSSNTHFFAQFISKYFSRMSSVELPIMSHSVGQMLSYVSSVSHNVLYLRE